VADCRSDEGGVHVPRARVPGGGVLGDGVVGAGCRVAAWWVPGADVVDVGVPTWWTLGCRAAGYWETAWWVPGPDVVDVGVPGAGCRVAAWWTLECRGYRAATWGAVMCQTATWGGDVPDGDVSGDGASRAGV